MPAGYVDIYQLAFPVLFEASEDGHSGLLSGHGRNAYRALQVDDADRYYRENRLTKPGTFS